MSHETALSKDARDQLGAGQILSAVITETNVDDDEGTCLTKHQGITTFVKTRERELEYGETVKIKIVDVGESHAEAIVVG